MTQSFALGGPLQMGLRVVSPLGLLHYEGSGLYVTEQEFYTTGNISRDPICK